MFRAHVLIIRRSKLHYTASGVITSIGGRLVHSLKEHETATYRCDDTRGCVMQFWPPDDDHVCSKYVEAWNKLIVKQKFCASSWLITEINVLRCKTSKNIIVGCSMLVVRKCTKIGWWQFLPIASQRQRMVSTENYLEGCGTPYFRRKGRKYCKTNYLKFGNTCYNPFIVISLDSRLLCCF